MLIRGSGLLFLGHPVCPFGSLSNYTLYSAADAEPEIFKGGGAEDNVSSFIANARNELYAIYMGKGGLLKQSGEPKGAPLNLPLLSIQNVQNYQNVNSCYI